MGNWDRFDEADKVPFFTQEERARITRIHNMMQDKYDPIAARLRTERRLPNYSQRERGLDSFKKIWDAEDAAGWPRSQFN